MLYSPIGSGSTEDRADVARGVLAAGVEPQSYRYDFSPPPEVEEESVEFRLTYRGTLPAASAGHSRAKEKQDIRRQLHRQLRILWEDHPALSSRLRPTKDGEISEVQTIANEYTRCGYRFVPLIRKDNGLACSLNILFLRRDNPGGVVKSGGDIDNRLKVLLDALRIPETRSELGGYDIPEDGEDPFFCLLEDDVLINDISVTTDRLLSPKENSEHIHEVMLVIQVITKIVKWHALLRYGF